jgi:hypothetical protein
MAISPIPVHAVMSSARAIPRERAIAAAAAIVAMDTAYDSPGEIGTLALRERAADQGEDAAWSPA